MAKISYTLGDATKPVGKGINIFTHVCNDRGGWGKGFELAISKQWKEPEREYRTWFRNKFFKSDNFNIPFELDQIQLIQVEPEIYVVNLIAQQGYTMQNGKPAIRYDALQECLMKLANEANGLNASIHMPRIGCGLAGGDWTMVESIIQKELIIKGNLEVTVYDFK